MDQLLPNLNIDFGTISHATGALVYLLVSVLLAQGYLRRNTDRALLVASLITTVWLGLLAFQSMTDQPPFYLRYSIEILRNAGWLSVLFIIIGVGFTPRRSSGQTQYWLGVFICGLIFLLLAATLSRGVLDQELISGKSLLIAQIALSLTGLVMLEQVWKNASGFNRSNIKYLSLAIGALFAYDFFMYSDALLFNQVSKPLWDARGAVNALVAPLLGLTLINSRRQPIEVQISRQFVFHTSALLVAGLYLMLMSVGGYYIKFFGGNWSAGLQVLFFFGALVFFIVLISSTKLRARLMVFISQHFFNYKYDYREEWLKITRMLTATDADESLPHRIIRVLISVVECHSGALWIKDEDNNFGAVAYVNMPDIKHHRIDLTSELIEFMRRSDWIIDLHEYQMDPTRYQLLEIPDCIWSVEKPWLIVPLFLKETLFGFVLVARPLAKLELNWENYDLIKVISRQACSYLALLQTQDRLAEAKQFEAVSRTSAFMVHDLKTIIAQLSLLIKNASKHKTNPVFVDDMIRTTEHAVNKMNHLLQQIRNPVSHDENEQFDLVEMLQDVVESHKKLQPIPAFDPPRGAVNVIADKEKLRSVVGHIVQNAQDATDKDGEVSLSLKHSPGFAVLFIQDTGCGMNEDFIKTQLFKPFESTKGLTGMGIGAYQSREYLRKIGGGIDVTSQVGIGTCFTLKIPIVGVH